eukprot:g16720.t1
MAARVPPAAVVAAPALKRSKILKNMSAVSGAMMLGDALCQGMETFDSGAKFSWDHARTLRMGTTGAFLVTPASFMWNMYAERIAPGTSVRAVVTKLGVSVAVLPPMLAAQFTSLTLLEKGKNLNDVTRKLSQDFVPTLKNAVVFWPVVSVFNSLFVPLLSRPMFSSFMGVFWNVYISYQANHNGMEVGEMSVVYPRSSQTQRQEEVVALVKEAVVEKKKAAEKTAVVAALAPGVNGARVEVSSVTAPVLASEGNPEATSEGEDGATSDAAPPGRKRRGRVVRRTSVMSM